MLSETVCCSRVTIEFDGLSETLWLAEYSIMISFLDARRPKPIWGGFRQEVVKADFFDGIFFVLGTIRILIYKGAF